MKEAEQGSRIRYFEGRNLEGDLAPATAGK
jgi:hypothetical protein